MILHLIPSLCFLFSFHVSSILLTAFSLLLFTCYRCLCTDLISSPCPSVFHRQSDIYFVSSAPVSSASNCSSRDTSSQSSPQTPTGYEMPVFPSPLGDGKPRTVNAPQDVGLGASLWKVFKCQCCLQTCLTLDAAAFAQSSRIHLHKRAGAIHWSRSLQSSSSLTVMWDLIALISPVNITSSFLT